METKTIAFTLCSNNYLAYAKTLADSCVKHNPNYKFIIGLVDQKHPDIDYSFFEPHEILEVEKLNLDSFEDMKERYNIIAFNTAVKPYYFNYLFKEYPEFQNIKYFDPDIMCFSSLQEFDEATKDYAISLTPHITTPTSNMDEKYGIYPMESRFLNYGLYNLGFLSLNRNKIIPAFLDWWEERLFHFGYSDLSKGLFVDQLWINLIPIYYPNDVYISYDLGMNMAHWNFHERNVKVENEHFMINEKFSLKFYHFSGFKIALENRISSRNQLSFEDRPDVKPIFDQYRASLLQNKIYDLQKIPYAYDKKEVVEVKNSGRTKLRNAYGHFREGIKALLKNNN